MTEDYDPRKDSFESYNVWIAWRRARLLRERCPAAKRVEVIGQCELYLGDCMEIMQVLEGVDAVITDPPYGIGAAAGMGGGGTDASGRWKRKPREYDGRWDDERPSPSVFQAILAISEVQIIWGGNYFADLLPKSGRWLFWDKLNSMPSYSDGEMAWSSLDGNAVKKFTRCKNGPASNRDGERVHPTQKPVDLMQWCLSFVTSSSVVCDPFMGSGTTGVACAKLGRRFMGIEIDEGYFNIACERIRKAYAQPDMFVEQRPKPQRQAGLFDGGTDE
ncbi:site-specific DNA-methyltransferase [Sinorhizobium meliloti]|nr:site-specific DNA-methyltransferase [Sinorhizobium meliloti]MDX0093460.1 site-specific DNA-methyltransferase [Sinorhizobium meliloti]